MNQSTINLTLTYEQAAVVYALTGACPSTKNTPEVYAAEFYYKLQGLNDEKLNSLKDKFIKLICENNYHGIIKFNQFKQESINIVLNSEYTAEVTKDIVKVGYYTFSSEIIDKLVEARKSLTT